MTNIEHERQSIEVAPRRVLLGPRFVLAAGFGGLLALMAAVGLDSFRVLGEIRVINAQIQRDYLSRQQTLQEISAALSNSGVAVRDYILLNPGEKTSKMLRAELTTIHDEMYRALGTYSYAVRPEERQPFLDLSKEIEEYWSVLNPVFEWSSRERDDRGYFFLREQIFPRRAAVLRLARSISAVNEQTLNDGEKRLTAVFARFRRRTQVMTEGGLSLGLIVALASILYIQRLQRQADQRYQESRGLLEPQPGENRRAYRLLRRTVHYVNFDSTLPLQP